jgi:hypothetical protein
MIYLYKGEIMKKRLLIMLIVLTGIFLIYTSIIYACLDRSGPKNDILADPDVESWTMKIKISGSTESIMNIKLADFTKLKNDLKRNSKGVRQGLSIRMMEPRIKTFCLIYNDDSKDPVIYTWYSETRRVKRHSKAEFENNKYENTALTLKEIMDNAVKLIDRDQVKINDHTVTVMERNIYTEEFILSLPRSLTTPEL